MICSQRIAISPTSTERRYLGVHTQGYLLEYTTLVRLISFERPTKNMATGSNRMQAKLRFAPTPYIPLPEGKGALRRFSVIVGGGENQETSPPRGSPRICFA